VDREQRDAVTRHYDDRAPTYDDGPLHRALAAAVADLVAEALAASPPPPTEQPAIPPQQQPPVVLDVATGTGLVLRALALTTSRPPGSPRPSGPSARLVGVDLSPGMLRIAATALPPPAAAFLRADATALPLADTSVDVVTLVTALHLLPSPAAADAAIAECRRVLRPGGHLLTATFNDPAPPPDPEITTGTRDTHDPNPRRRHEAYATVDQLTAVLAPHGLTVRDHRTWTDGAHHLLLCHATPSTTPSTIPASGPVPPAPPTSQ